MPARTKAAADIFALRRGPATLGGPFRLRPRLEQTLRLLPGSGGRRRIRLALDVAPHVPETLVGDARALRRTVADLVGLAVRRMDRGDASDKLGIPIGEIGRIQSLTEKLEQEAAARAGKRASDGVGRSGLAIPRTRARPGRAHRPRATHPAGRPIIKKEPYRR